MDVNIKPETSNLHVNIEEVDKIGPVQDIEIVNEKANKSNNTIKQYKVKKEGIKKYSKTISKNVKRSRTKNRVKSHISNQSNGNISDKDFQIMDEGTQNEDEFENTAPIDVVKQRDSDTSSSDDEEDSPLSSMQTQNKAQKPIPILTKILTIPLVRCDAKLLESSKNTTNFPVVGNTSKVETYIFEEHEDTIIKKEIKREPSVDPDNLESEDESLNTEIENSESGELSSNIEMENSEPGYQSQSVRVVSQGSWAPPVSQPSRLPLNTNGTNGTNGNNGTNGRPPLPRDRGSLIPAAEDPAVINYFVHFLRNVGAELKAMPLEDALELQAQMEQLIQRKRLLLLERRADLQQSVNRTGNQLGTSTINWNSQKKNSSIIYMTYSNGDDNEDEQ